jgi:solute carrier family 25, member 39/40
MSSAVAADCAVEETQRKTFNSTLDAMRKIARNEGYTTLWRGLTPTLVMAIPGNVIYFTGYDWLRYNQSSPIRRVASDAYAPLIAGSVARMMAGIAVSPMEMFRTRMQATAGNGGGVLKETFRDMQRMTQTQGYTSLWRGLTLTLWRDVPFSALYWWGYEAIRNKLSDVREARNGNVLDPIRSLTSERAAHANQDQVEVLVDSFIGGAGAGAVAAFVTTPFDVGKTRQQVFHHAGDDAPSKQAAKQAHKAGRLIPEELSMPRFLHHIYTEEGARGLFRGWAARVMKVAPACAIMISCYELGKKWAKAQNEKEGDGKALA